MPRSPGRGGRPERVARSGVLAVAGLTAGLLLAGCSAQAGGGDAAGPGGAAGVSPATDGTAGPGASAPERASTLDLTAELVQYRRDAQRDVIQLKVTNHGETAVQVGRVQVRSPTFAEPLTVEKDSTVGAGLSVDLALPLAEPACEGTDDAATTSADEHAAVLEVDGTTVELAVDDRVLQQVREQRCAEAAVGDLVRATWQPTWQDAGAVDGSPALRGRLVLTPLAPDPVTVGVAGATTLFRIDEPVEARLRGEPEVLDVVVTVTRCDAHAIAEDKKGYLFPVQVQPDGGAELLVEVAVPVPERVALQDLLDRTCR